MASSGKIYFKLACSQSDASVKSLSVQTFGDASPADDGEEWLALQGSVVGFDAEGRHEVVEHDGFGEYEHRDVVHVRHAAVVRMHPALLDRHRQGRRRDPVAAEHGAELLLLLPGREQRARSTVQKTKTIPFVCLFVVRRHDRSG